MNISHSNLLPSRQSGWNLPCQRAARLQLWSKGAKVLKVYEIMKWKFQVNLQLTSWKALGWVQRSIIEFLSCQLFCILGNRQLEVQKAPLMHLIQAAHEVRSTCKRCRESTRYAWRGVIPFLCQLKGLKGQSGSLVSSQELGSNHSFDVDTMHLFLVGSLTQKLFGSTQQESAEVQPALRDPQQSYDMMWHRPFLGLKKQYGRPSECSFRDTFNVVFTVSSCTAVERLDKQMW